ncbi:hypothetical protein ONZ43_g322 [Nemania bipapillata]|uniref:Uncharacterized protein n=1 Tax=Nemania bipapillata TaxID=110536 RepID=A0ACC2J8T2_9PEZI|nr:hypothetical protein ONZ43_g322 [Nemania bipapillata]
MASDSQNPSQVFEDAQNRFLGSLGTEDRALYSPCESSEDFTAAVKSLESKALSNQRRAKSFKCIYSLSKRLEPFFKVINIFIQADSQYSALVWGAFRLVIQLSSSITTFFDKLLALLNQILDAFPRYEDILKLCNSENSERIRKNVEEVYVDLLSIFQAGIVYLELKPTPLVLGGLLWQPFDVRFKDLIDKMAVHQYNISHELQVWQLKRDDENSSATAKWRQYIRQELEDAEQERQAVEKERSLMAEERRQNTQAREKISALLSELRDTKLALEKQRIVDHAKYRFWRDEETRPHPNDNRKKFGPNLIWLHGHPGAGKSVLATLILDTLDEENAELQEPFRHFVLYHFFKFDDFKSISPADAFRSMASQILANSRHDKDIVDKFSFILESKTQGQSNVSEETLVDLLLMCIDHRTVIVVDGIDECSDSDSFVYSLLKISHTCQAKILLLSRINVPHLQRSVPKESQLSLPKNEISKDIRRFFEYELNDLIEEEILPESALGQIDVLTEHLVKGADGMFLWARLMMQYLRSSTFSPNMRMKIISEINFPEGLEKMYNRIFVLINQSGQSSRDLAMEVLMWLTFSASQMSSSQIRQAVTVDSLWSSDNENEDMSVFENAALMACKGLVQREPVSDASNGLRFIHLTVKEALTTPLGPTNLLAPPSIPNCVVMPNSQIANLRLAFCCIRQLIYHTPPEPLSGEFNKSISNADLAQRLPFTDYAALYWMEHLSATSKSNAEVTSTAHIDASFKETFVRFAPELKRFLSTPKSVTVWLEAYYTSSNNSPPSGVGIRQWASWLSEMIQETDLRVEGSLLGLLFEFRSDLDRIVAIWDQTLQRTPHTIWDEAASPGLTPSNIFFSPGSTRVQSYAPKTPEGCFEAQEPLLVKSAVSSDGLLLGVLSLWGMFV